MSDMTVKCPTCASHHVVRLGATGFSCLLCGFCWPNSAVASSK